MSPGISRPNWNPNRASAPTGLSTGAALQPPTRLPQVKHVQSNPGLCDHVPMSLESRTSATRTTSPSGTPPGHDRHQLSPKVLGSGLTNQRLSISAPPGPPLPVDFEAVDSNILVRQPAGPLHLLPPGTPSASLQVNTGQAHAFSGPLFSGKMAVYIRGLPGQPEGQDIFANRRRKSWLIVQGRFKQRVATSECVFSR
jgi:hypothetical protein